MQKVEKVLNKLVGFQRETVEDIDWKKIWKQLKWMNSFSKGYRGRLGFLTGVSIFFTLIGIWFVYLYRDMVDYITGNVQGIISMITTEIEKMRYQSFSFKVSHLYSLLPDWIIWLVIGYLVYKIVTYLYSLYMEFFGLRLSMDLALGIKRKVYATILEADWMSLTKYAAGDLVQRATSDAETVSGFAMSTVPSMISQAVQFIVALFALLTQNGWLTLFAFIGIPMYLFVIRLKGRRMHDFNKRSLELGAKHSSFLYESMSNIMVIKSFMLVPEFIRRYRDLHQQSYDLTVERKKYGIATGAIIGMLGRALSVGMFIIFTVMLIDGKMTMGSLAAFTMLSSRVSGPVTAFMGFFMNSIETAASAERVMTLYEIPKDKTQVPDQVKAFSEKAKRDGMGLVMDDLAFAYIENRYVLHDVNLQVNPGETVALVGPSGEGKTTLIRLALGLLTPNHGDAKLVSGRGEALDLSVETREFFSYVPQGNTMFSGSIRENMELGNMDATEDMMIDALKQACIWDFIEQLPEGIDSVLGERGVGVSEGQAQRLAIARALLRDAPILLLDEATSALDIYTEKQVLDNIFQSGKNKTCILTTHRPSVFDVCDKIYNVRKQSVELIKSSRGESVSF